MGFARKTLCCLTALLMCLLPALSLAEGVRFTLQADIDPVQLPQKHRQTLEGLASLADAAALAGTLQWHEGSFDLETALTLEGDGRPLQVTLHLYGLDSHWGLTSSLLGDEALMINNAALLEFGMKARTWLGLPLDQAALLHPYTHAHSLAAARPLLAPLLPEACGTWALSQGELNALAEELYTLCCEDAALSRYLEAMGLLDGTLALLDALTAMDTGLTVTRTEDSLLWEAGPVTLLSLKENEGTLLLDVQLPVLGSLHGTLRQDAGFAAGAVRIQTAEGSTEASFTLPTNLDCPLPGFFLTLEHSEGSTTRTLRMEGERLGSVWVFHLYEAPFEYPWATVTATMTPFAPEEPPRYTPEMIGGMNILSVNGDSLAALMQRIREPLLKGGFDLLVAAPADAVQTLMDLLEDAGVIDLLTDAMSGGYGY